jgi:hypothetical protein
MGADIWTASVRRWIDRGAYPRALRALEARPELAYRVIERTLPLFEDPALVPALSNVVEKGFERIVLERADAVQALRFAGTIMPTAQKRVGIEVLEAVARSETGDPAEKARLMMLDAR